MKPVNFFNSHSHADGGSGSRPRSESGRRGQNRGALRVPLRGDHLSRHACSSVCDALADGKVGLIPTDTGFCYVGDPDAPDIHRAFLRLRSAHPKHKPFSLIVPTIASLSQIAVLDTPQYRVIKKLLPGPYTVILQKNKRTPVSATSQKGSTVGVRQPAISYIDELMAVWEKPLLATSVTDADELLQAAYYESDQSPDAWWANGSEIVRLHGHEIAVWVDPDEPQPMRASTIFDLTDETPVMLRDGGWDLGELTFDFVRPEDRES
jgi:tRNA threonylcarbamoyl adenosine modification protein (Sua5/YciO/YrdC/YwlC family)